MQILLNCLYIFGVITSTVFAAHLPESFKTCKKSDPNYKACLKSAIENSISDMKDGVASLSVPKIDPLYVENVHIGGNGGKVDLETDYKDLYMYGFSRTKVEDAELLLDGADCKIKLSLLIPQLNLVGQYKMVGKVLLLQLNGFGANNISLINLKSDLELNCEKVPDKNGKQVLKLTDAYLDINTKQPHFEFENLIQGNPQLSQEVLKVVNENSVEIFEEIRKDYARAFVVILKQIGVLILSKVPYEEYYKA